MRGTITTTTTIGLRRRSAVSGRSRLTSSHDIRIEDSHHCSVLETSQLTSIITHAAQCNPPQPPLLFPPCGRKRPRSSACTVWATAAPVGKKLSPVFRATSASHSRYCTHAPPANVSEQDVPRRDVAAPRQVRGRCLCVSQCAHDSHHRQHGHADAGLVRHCELSPSCSSPFHTHTLPCHILPAPPPTALANPVSRATHARLRGPHSSPLTR